MNILIQRYAKAIWLALGLMTLGGMIAAFTLPVSLFPQINYPRVVVSIDAGERDPQQMAALITTPLEGALRAVPGVTRLRSTTSRGSAEASLSFAWGENMVAATLATQAAIAGVLPDMPAGHVFQCGDLIQQYFLYSGSRLRLRHKIRRRCANMPNSSCVRFSAQCPGLRALMFKAARCARWP